MNKNNTVSLLSAAMLVEAVTIHSNSISTSTDSAITVHSVIKAFYEYTIVSNDQQRAPW